MTKSLSYMLIGISLLAAPVLSQAGVSIDIEVAPPPVLVQPAPPPRVGYVWAPGYWQWEGHRHVWVEGYWLRERRGSRWVPEHWIERHHQWHFEPGHWERG
jgi:hypothetical protein